MKNKKIIFVSVLIVIAVCSAFMFTACKGEKGENRTDLRFAVPDGTPALAISKMFEDNKTLEGYNMNYAIVAPNLIASEMTGGKADILIMPTNAGAAQIKKGVEYKLAAVSVEGSLYVVGKGSGELTLDGLVADLKSGKKMASIGLTSTPGIVFKYLAGSDYDEIKNNIEAVSDASQAINALSRESNACDYALVGEPAATAVIGKPNLNVNKRLNLQTEYAKKSGVDNFPQASLFVKNSLVTDTKFMTALFAALEASRDWIFSSDAATVNARMESAGSTSKFPADSISRCAVAVKKAEGGEREIIKEYLALMNITVGDDIFVY